MNLRSFLLLLLSAAMAHGAPMSQRELQFLVRQRTPDAEIVRDATQRKLLTPLDSAAEQALRQAGASDALIAALRQPDLALPPAAAQAEMARQRAEQVRASQAAPEPPRQREPVVGVSRPGAIRQMLDGRLVRLEGDSLKPFDAQPLADAKIVAFYYSAMWCGPCRKFTPKLVEAYQRLKAKYPTQFELVFVSADRDEFNMAEYMRSYRMPWPAVRLGAATPEIQQFSGSGIPWLVAVSGSGLALTRNGVDKNYINPAQVLGATEAMLADIARRAGQPAPR